MLHMHPPLSNTTQKLTISHFVELHVLLNILCKLHSITSLTHTQQKNLFAQLEHFIII